ncbi:MAG: ParB/RepB/Spo0J family partition protein [Erysipelotrichaceae bacterium]|nr:ParB/RepB/Spo0J family partition protein [Erysipelotrichaceae bacterium]
MSQLKQISIDKIKSNPYQPRISFEEKGIRELAESIRENGLLQPISVRETYFGYDLIAGERRLKACQLLGMQEIPAIVIDAGEVQSAQLALIENIQREDLNAIEEAAGYLQILKLTGLTQQQLADKLGRSQSSIANKLRLLNLSEEVKEAVSSGLISERHGRALLAADEEKQKKLLETIIRKNLTVQQTEELISRKPVKRGGSLKCFGVSEKILINSLRESYNKCRQLSDNVTMEESEDDEYYTMTIKVRKTA